MKYSLVQNNDFASITVFIDGELLTITSEAPRFQEIVTKVVANDTDGLADLFSPEKAIANSFEKISTQITIRNGKVFFEGRETHSTLADHIVEFWEEGNSNLTPLALFTEKLYSNPNEKSRDMLYDWMTEAKISISSDGNIVGYKGVTNDLRSIHSGPGIVNGVPENGQLDNSPGNIVEMDRDEVTFDPDNSCAAGLHIGTYAYANSFGTRVMEVSIDPRDVVSVPAYEHAKMRVCRYKVVQEIFSKYDSALVESEDDGLDDPVEGWDQNESEDGNVGWTEVPITGGSFFIRPITDTRDNHLTQKRDANGRFIKK